MKVLSEDANRIEKFAAKELPKYLRRMVDKQFSTTLNRKVKRRIYVGVLPIGLRKNAGKEVSKDPEEMRKDGFIIRTIGGRLLVLGKEPRATLYGVYQYLQILA